VIDNILKRSAGSTESLLRRFGINPDVEDEDELCWLQLWAAARDIDIESEHFWEFHAREIAAVLNYGVHSEEEWKKLEAQKQKFADELWDARREIARQSFRASLHHALHPASTRTAPPLPDESTQTQPELTRQAESAGAKPNVIEFWPGTGAEVRRAIAANITADSRSECPQHRS
jgi:hypothetical protein